MPGRFIVRTLLVSGLLACVALVPARSQETAREQTTWPGLTPSGAVLLPNGWSLKPAGRQVTVGNFPTRIVACPTEPILAVLHAGYGTHEVMMLDAKSFETLARYTIPQTFGGLAFSADGRTLYVGGGADDVIYRYIHTGAGLLADRQTIAYPAPHPSGPRVIADLALDDTQAGVLWVSNAFAHTVARFDLGDGSLKNEIALEKESFPYALALSPDTKRLYASLWGKAAVALIDTASGEQTATWPTDDHPNDMELSADGSVLYVSNANRNTVSVIDTDSGQALETINTAIAPNAPDGSTPNALALSPDGKALFVANANTNDVAVIDVDEPGEARPLGLIPVGWYPTALLVTADGASLLVANGKGSTSSANRDGPNPLVRSNSVRQYIGGLFQGTMSVIPMPSPEAMARYTQTVYACSPLNREHPEATPAGRPADSPIPGQVGDPSPITHCVYIVKENRTYDQLFGDMPHGNGDPSLCLFPEAITPNHHALAREFVLLDNFYVESEVSADGHEWSMAAYATDYVERTWPLNYRGDNRFPYPSEGVGPVIAHPTAGYLWDRAAAKNVSFFSFGEFISNPVGDRPAVARVASLEGHFDPQFMGYNLDVQDQARADRFLEVLGQWNEAGEMPRLVILRLPNDHTSGTRVGKPTPTAMMADNDLALGRVVEGLSASRFWPSMAIFVVEDDAQNGSDHVDAHRTIALAVSPYTRRGSLDSTLYSTSSMLRTMELILGLDPMSQFDASATPMWNSFQAAPDLTPYASRPAGTDLNALNEPTAWGAETSAELNLAQEDAADDLIFNEIIWRSVKGPDSPMPPPVRAVFVFPSREDDDDDDTD